MLVLCSTLQFQPAQPSLCINRPTEDKVPPHYLEMLSLPAMPWQVTAALHDSRTGHKPAEVQFCSFVYMLNHMEVFKIWCCVDV